MGFVPETGARVRKALEARGTVVLVFFLVATLLTAASPQRQLDHDEHQFVASAYLFGEQGLLPYLDYAYFHVPYLVVPYSLLFQATDHLLLSARLFSVACSLITLALIGGYAARLSTHADLTWRVGAGLGCVVLLVGNPLFIYTYGRAWNHAASLMLAVAATLVFLPLAHRPRRAVALAVPGALLGFAIGTRLTLLPLLLPFLAGIHFLRTDRPRFRDQLGRFGWFGAGTAVSLLPVLFLLAAAPGEFLFGNFRYPTLNTLYRQATGYRDGMTIAGKGLFFLEHVLIDPGNLIIFALLVFVAIRFGLEHLPTAAGRQFAFLLSLIGFSLPGALAPTPSFTQYFYGTIPFTLLAIARGMAVVGERPEQCRALLRFFAVAVVFCALRAAPSYWIIFHKRSPVAPTAVETHALGLEIRNAIGTGRVLTLAPILPLEAGLEIYTPFTTGPFAWRTAPFLPASDRQRHRVIAPADLDELLRGQPPAAILLGVEPEDLEQPMLDYARMHEYRAVPLNGAITLWVPPGSRWDAPPVSPRTD